MSVAPNDIVRMSHAWNRFCRGQWHILNTLSCTRCGLWLFSGAITTIPFKQGPIEWVCLAFRYQIYLTMPLFHLHLKSSPNSRAGQEPWQKNLMFISDFIPCSTLISVCEFDITRLAIIQILLPVHCWCKDIIIKVATQRRCQRWSCQHQANREHNQLHCQSWDL